MATEARWLVTLVGRPNVGKSTLFNRLLGRRHAIVDDQPGVTRDRHYSDTEWAGKHFTLVDTGGFVPDSVDTMESAIREQAQLAIEQANLILFIVDAEAGVVPAEREIAEILRKTDKQVMLIANKSDGDKKEYGASEFYELGLGDPIPISALIGRKIGDLLDLITKDMPTSDGTDGDTRLKIAVIGKPNAGKSSLVNALLQEERHIVTDIPGTTRDPIDAILKHYGEEIVLIDTAGLRRKSKVKESVELYSALRTIKAIERCDVAIILVDAQDGVEHQDLRIIETAMEKRTPAIIAVNKWDLVEKDDRTAAAYEKAIRERLRIYDFLPIMFVSALSKQRIYKLIEMAKEVRAEAQKRISTSQLNDRLLPEVTAHPPRSRSGKEIKIKFITQVKSEPPVFAFFANEPQLIEDSYIRFLENRLREQFGFTGVPLVISLKKK
ncbi:MAG: ribosome biogenesis GTPase Der [Ignavibacteriae bacterium]|nr:ribosome biogenesis GTPase Der [Ignavibacteriota bacterium]